MNIFKLGSLAILALTLQACADRPIGLEYPGFGDAVRTNMAAQTVNPMAPTDRSPLTMEGQRAALQQNRYTTDMVEKPPDVGTLQGAVSGGGGGGGGSGAGAGGGAR